MNLIQSVCVTIALASVGLVSGCNNFNNVQACQDFVAAINDLPCMPPGAQLDANSQCPESLDDSGTNLTGYYMCIADSYSCDGDFLQIDADAGCTIGDGPADDGGDDGLDDGSDDSPDDGDGADQPPPTVNTVFSFFNQDSDNIHILMPDEFFDASNRIVPGETRVTFWPFDVGTVVELSAGRNGTVLRTATCPTITETTLEFLAVWTAGSFTCTVE